MKYLKKFKIKKEDFEKLYFLKCNVLKTNSYFGVSEDSNKGFTEIMILNTMYKKYQKLMEENNIKELSEAL